jgi:hypothetical protein
MVDQAVYIPAGFDGSLQGTVAVTVGPARKAERPCRGISGTSYRR